MKNFRAQRYALSFLLLSALCVGNTYADGETVTCTPTDQVLEGGLPGPAVSNLSVNNKMYLICVSTDMKTGQKLSVTYTPDGSDKGVTKTESPATDATQDAPYIVDMGMGSGAKPMPGSYQAQVMIDNNPVETISFTISE